VTDPRAHLRVLAQLLDVARLSAFFPDPRRVLEWVALLEQSPKVELHPVSALPTKRLLMRLLQRQQLARAFFAAHRARPRRATDQFNVSLAAAELWVPRTEARVMTAERAASRLLVVHDRFDAKTGALLRFSVQVQQRGAKHVRVERGANCTCSGPFIEAVEQACDADATAAALRLDALEALQVVEVVRGELGPLFTAHAASAAARRVGA